jgi:hypothetical protein
MLPTHTEHTRPLSSPVPHPHLATRGLIHPKHSKGSSSTPSLLPSPLDPGHPAHRIRTHPAASQNPKQPPPPLLLGPNHMPHRIPSSTSHRPTQTTLTTGSRNTNSAISSSPAPGPSSPASPPPPPSPSLRSSPQRRTNTPPSVPARWQPA